jgi:hypothetical protein
LLPAAPQPKFDTFIEEFNAERPHEALAMKCPAEVSILLPAVLLRMTGLNALDRDSQPQPPDG